MGSPEEVAAQSGIKEGFLDSRANVWGMSGTSPGKKEGKTVGGRGTGYAKAFIPGRAWHIQSVWKKMASVLSQLAHSVHISLPNIPLTHASIQ